MGIRAAFGGHALLPSARQLRAAGDEALLLIARYRPAHTAAWAAFQARHAARLLLYGGPAVRIAAASAVALTASMCSYWAQSSVRPSVPLAPAQAAPQQQSTAKADRLDAYVREERAGALLDPGRAAVSASLAWPLSDRFTAGVQVGPHGERAYGIRIFVPVGTPVRAAADGVVDFAGNGADGYGQKVVLKHGAIRSVYGHLSAILVGPNATVRKGQVIAKSGQSGIATSPRLYLGLIGADQALDPIKFFGRTGTLERCGATLASCGERKPKPSVTAPLQEPRPVPPSSIPLPVAQRAATL